MVQCSNAPTFVRFLMALLLTAFLGPSGARAQGTEPPSPYDPCVATAPSTPSCLDGSRSCYYVQPICSPGYCWSGGVPSVNAGIPFDGIVANKVIEIGGVYTITQNVRFVNCTFRMLGDARVNISPAGNALMKIFFENCDFYGCNAMWQGIVVDASAASAGLLFAFWNGNIEDAYIGLRLDEGGDATSYQITSNTFRNNHIGIANLRQIGGELNAEIRRNQFFQTANLAARVGSLIDDNDPNTPPLMPGYPLAYAGVKYVSVSTTIGVNLHAEVNLFRCLLNGLITEGSMSRVTSVNNTFETIGERGIGTTNGRMEAINCRFRLSGLYGIATDGAVLTASSNQFSGNWGIGIWSVNNLNSQLIRIHQNNTFTINSGSWTVGILVERPQSTDFGVPACIIDHNTFSVAGDVKNFTCITLLDLVDAFDEAQITWNTINVTSTQVPVYGIGAVLGNSDNLYIEENVISYGPVGIDFIGGFGIVLTPVVDFVQNASQGHVVRHNTITGANTVLTGPLHCAIHSASVQGIEYCDNDVDYSSFGLHFVFDCGDVALRQNHMHHHRIGLLIAGSGGGLMPGIGPQFGRGNTWNIPLGDCVDKAVKHEVPSAGFVITSPFRVPEFTNPPFRFMPHNSKISPDPTMLGPNQNWFLELVVDTDYCAPGLEAEPTRKLTAYEKKLVDGLSPYTGTTLWDLKLRAYTKLLLRPELRLAGSPEEAFFSSLANTTISSFGQVIQMMGNSLAMSAADRQLFDNYNTAAQQAAENLTAWDTSQDYSSTDNLTETWFAARLVLLRQLSANTANQAALEASRNALVSANLQNALIYNAGISTSQTYEAANKALYDIWLRRLLQEPMTQAYYNQILALAQQDPASAGHAATAAANFVAPCDRYLFPYDEGDEVAQRGPARHQEGKPLGLAEFRITPNPSTGLVEVSLPANMATSFVVMNAYGQTVRSVEMAEGTRSISLDLTQLPSGLYWGVLLDAQGHRIGIEALSLNH